MFDRQILRLRLPDQRSFLAFDRQQSAITSASAFCRASCDSAAVIVLSASIERIQSRIIAGFRMAANSPTRRLLQERQRPFRAVNLRLHARVGNDIAVMFDEVLTSGGRVHASPSTISRMRCLP